MGGRARSPAKTAANRAKARRYWEEVRAGQRPGPRRPKCPPPAERLAELLADYCRERGIRRLEVFGSVARGTARRGSDVDLIATFTHPPGLAFFAMEEELAELLGVPVHLLTSGAVARMSNPYRKAAIERERRVIHEA